MSETISTILNKKYLPSQTRIASENTERLYRVILRKWDRSLCRSATLDDLNDDAVARFAKWQLKLGRAAATVNGDLNKLRALWNWCAKRKMVGAFPTFADVPEPRRIPEGWSQAQLNALLAGCAKMPGLIAGVAACDWWAAHTLFIFDTGERSGAVRGLTWDLFNPATGHMEVPADIRKGGRMPMLYRLKPQTVAALEKIRLPNRRIIFAFDGCGCKFYYQYKKLLRLSGLPYVKHRSGPQKIRRSFASHLEAAGGNATAALAHTSRRVTMQSYLDPRIAQTESPNLKLFDLGVGF